LRALFSRTASAASALGALVSIKSDNWIRRMAREQRMIEPFEPGQVRENGGQRIVSYGTSSYGYDVRCASEFKIFTNINSTIVDPKAFDEKSFVDFGGDVCIIPPNSFALARTVEFFRIPRSVLTICLGKSTYARCFRGDTRVALVNGRSATFEEMTRGHDAGELFWGYSIGTGGRMIVTLLDAPRFIGRDVLLEIGLDNGEFIHATPDHLFMRRDGRMVEAHTLRPGQPLMPLYRDLVRGYEAVYQPVDGFMYPTHRLADEWNLRHGVYADLPGTHRHHRDFDRRNNYPTNIERMEASAHIRLHNSDSYGEEFDPLVHGAAIRAALERRAQSPQWREDYARAQALRAREFWHGDRYKGIRQRLIEQLRNPSEQTRAAHRRAMLRRYADPAERERHAQVMVRAWAADDGSRRTRQAEVARRLNLRPEITSERVARALHVTGSIRGAADLLQCDRSVFRRFPSELAEFRGLARYRNHKVASIRELPGEHDVYCLTVPEAGNFALEAGVFVRNCGIIVNVTPLEPEWEGHVTLEFSNTTPLPAKIYANEGVAQMLFFESDEVCATSYKDRGGKYQGQRGVTLPKT
jgi:deoxycytidine triphosphate deaminase/intein/homing endonuclease